MQSNQHFSPARDSERNQEIERQAYYLVNTHANFQRRASRFEFRCTDDVLVVRGNVPTFYLKQVLQSVLQNVDGIRVVDNRVDVVASDGLGGVVRY